MQKTFIDGFVKSRFKLENVILSGDERYNEASSYEILSRYIGTQNDNIRLFTSSSFIDETTNEIFF